MAQYKTDNKNIILESYLHLFISLTDYSTEKSGKADFGVINKRVSA